MGATRFPVRRLLVTAGAGSVHTVSVALVSCGTGTSTVCSMKRSEIRSCGIPWASASSRSSVWEGALSVSAKAACSEIANFDSCGLGPLERHAGAERPCALQREGADLFYWKKNLQTDICGPGGD